MVAVAPRKGTAVTFARAIRTCLRNYLTFSGRAPRREYWYFIVFIFAGSILCGLVDTALFDTAHIETTPGGIEVENNGPVATVFGIAMVPPAISAGWRRMHDTGRSGLYLLYPAIVVVGIGTFAGLVSGFGPVVAGDFGTVIAGGSALILGVSLFVALLSPLLVIWWLTRPTEPRANAFGPEPARPG